MNFTLPLQNKANKLNIIFLNLSYLYLNLKLSLKLSLRSNLRLKLSLKPRSNLRKENDLTRFFH
ncbi:hypothetical protein CKF54_00720 [Psittacicella hinzii]|uniref:Uncharacterized protein n=1 Tax=Psittacicella hinzii TaxID=2028575 RepID=A0A3A1YA34_9GAMM|nr:hypothetical protein CKF54_00720 [Psittacicella hinzii]